MITLKVLQVALVRERWVKIYTSKIVEIWTSPTDKMRVSIMGKGPRRTLCVSMPGRAESIELNQLDFAEFRAILSEQWRESKAKRLRRAG